MKKIMFLFCFFSFILFAQEQDRFIIGADWLNSITPHPYYHFQDLRPEFWDTVKSFGLNYGALNMGFSAWSNTRVLTELDKANVRNIRIFLDTYRFYPTNGRRWMYQAEDQYDFLTHGTGEGYNEIQNNYVPELHWSKVKIDEGVNNHIRLNTSQYSQGYVIENLRRPSEIPDSATYYLKIGIRKTQSINDSTKICRIVIKNKTTGDSLYKILRASDIHPSDIWIEKFVFQFNKLVTGPKSDDVIESNYELNDTLGLTGIEDYVFNEKVTYTPYEIKLYWYGEINCDIDYVVVEDSNSFRLHNGNLDYIFNNAVTPFKDDSALGNIKIMDEPHFQHFLPLRYTNTKVSDYLGVSNQSKHALAFCVPQRAPVQRFAAETRLNKILTDIYPIPYYNADSSLFVRPGDLNYTPILQDRFQTNLINHLTDVNQTSSIFDEPFWFTVQAHEWTNPRWHREPSAYEIKAMANLGICSGTKGIYYFMFTKPVGSGTGFLDANNISSLSSGIPVPRYLDNYGYPKWATIKNYNHYLALVGNELLQLVWQNAISIHQGQPVESYINSLMTNDSPNQRYIQLATFKRKDALLNPNLEYFFVVNRRTLPTEQRNITITINKNSSTFNNWKIVEVGSSNSWVITKTGNFQTTFEPGEGKLFRLEPVMIAGGTLAVHETVPASTTLNIKGTINVPAGRILTINSGCNLNFPNRTALLVSGNLNIYGTNNQKVTFDFEAGSLIESTPPEGIKLYSGSTSNIQYAIIKNAPTGIYAVNCQPEITNTEIFDCLSGLYLNECNYTPGDWYGTMIMNCNFHDNNIGMYLTSSSPYLNSNSFEENLTGLYCADNSSPFLGELTEPGTNYFYRNDNHIYSYFSTPVIGIEGEEYIAGYNTFEEPANHHIVAEYESYVMAENNCWQPFDERYFVENFESYIDYNPNWECGKGSAPQKENSLSAGTALNKGGNNNPYIQFIYAVHELKNKNKHKAKTIFKKLIKDYVNDDFIIHPFEFLRKICETNNELYSLITLGNTTLTNNVNPVLQDYLKLLKLKKVMAV